MLHLLNTDTRHHVCTHFCGPYTSSPFHFTVHGSGDSVSSDPVKIAEGLVCEMFLLNVPRLLFSADYLMLTKDVYVRIRPFSIDTGVLSTTFSTRQLPNILSPGISVLLDLKAVLNSSIVNLFGTACQYSMY